jgi:hypothetical protein
MQAMPLMVGAKILSLLLWKRPPSRLCCSWPQCHSIAETFLETQVTSDKAAYGYQSGFSLPSESLTTTGLSLVLKTDPASIAQVQ